MTNSLYVLVLGLLLGVKHAFDGDHIAAIPSILSTNHKHNESLNFHSSQ